MLRLIMTCCDPVLEVHEQTALTLATVVGLSGAEIANAFLAAPRTIEQRLVRARRRLRERRQEYSLPATGASHQRVEAALQVIHLTFNEGYWSGSDEQPIRKELCRLAEGLARSVASMLPDHAEALGLLALLTFHRARMPARLDSEGWPVRLEEQDRSLWDQALINVGKDTLDRAIGQRTPGAFQVEAAISSLHMMAATAGDTDWSQIALLYERLEELRPSPVVRLNRSFAVAKADGAEQGLALLEPVMEHPALESYIFARLVRAELFEQLGRTQDAQTDLERAAALARSDPERREVARRMGQLRRKSSTLH